MTQSPHPHPQGQGASTRPGPSTAPGWYPDTVGNSTAFRWWNGSAWTQAVSESLWEPEPRHAPPYVPAAPRSPSTPTAPTEFELDEEPTYRKPLLIGIGTAAVLVVAVLGVLAFGAYSGDDSEAAGSDQPPAARDSDANQDGNSGKSENGGEGAGPERSGQNSRPTPEPTPERTPGTSVDGWPAFEPLGKEWWTGDESVLPHARVRHFTTEENYHKDDDWIATVMVGEIPKEVEPDQELARTASRVADWYAGIAFGPDVEPDYEELADAPTTVADRPAHRLEVRMPYRLNGLEATSDDVEILVIDLGPDRRPGLYLAAVPDTNPELWEVCDRAKESLSLDG